MKKVKLIFTLFAFLAFSSGVQHAYAWSLFSPDLTGEWVQDSSFLPVYLTFYPDGKLKITGFSHYTYKASSSKLDITAHDIFGGSSTSTHKYSYEKGILSIDPGIYGAEHFKRVN